MLYDRTELMFDCDGLREFMFSTGDMLCYHFPDETLVVQFLAIHDGTFMIDTWMLSNKNGTQYAGKTRYTPERYVRNHLRIQDMSFRLEYVAGNDE